MHVLIAYGCINELHILLGNNQSEVVIAHLTLALIRGKMEQ